MTSAGQESIIVTDGELAHLDLVNSRWVDARGCEFNPLWDPGVNTITVLILSLGMYAGLNVMTYCVLCIKPSLYILHFVCECVYT